MIGQGIQEKQALRRGVHTGGEKLRLLQQNAAALRPISQQKGWCFPFRRELFTFSTGFSTDFVKKGPVSHEVFHFFHRVFHMEIWFCLYKP